MIMGANVICEVTVPIAHQQLTQTFKMPWQVQVFITCSMHNQQSQQSLPASIYLSECVTQSECGDSDTQPELCIQSY